MCLCFHLSIHPSKARKFVNPMLLARLRDFSLIAFPLIAMLFEGTFLNQVKTASSRSLLSLIFNFFQLGFTWLESHDSMIFVLFGIHFDIVFSFALYSSATLFLFFFLLLFSPDLHFVVIEVCTVSILTKFTTVQYFAVQQKN